MGIRDNLAKAGNNIKKAIMGGGKSSGGEEPTRSIRRSIEYTTGPTNDQIVMAQKMMGLLDSDLIKDSKSIRTQNLYVSDEQGVEPLISFSIFDQMYEQSSWVRAAVDVITKAVTANGWSLRPLLPDADLRNKARLMKFFETPNPQDTLIEILNDITRDSFVFANAFSELVFDTDEMPREWWSLDATAMRARVNKHGLILGYTQAPGFGLGSTSTSGTANIPFAPREIIHLKIGTKGSSIYGLSPLVSLVLPVTVDKFAQVYNRAFFTSGAKFRVAFIMKDGSQEQVERNRDYLKKRAKDLDSAQSDLVLEGGVEIKNVSMTQKDMEFLELREFTRNEILAVYGVPPAMVSIIETGNIGAGTGDTQRQNFYDETITPFQRRVAAKITRQIIREGFKIEDWAFEFNKRTIDEKQQADIFKIYLDTGVLTPEEVRLAIGNKIPEVHKGLPAGEDVYGDTIEQVEEIYKAAKARLVGPSKTIVNATRSIIRLENRFLTALERTLREIRRKLLAGLPKIASSPAFRKKAVSIGAISFQSRMVERLPYAFRRHSGGDVVDRLIKQIDELEDLLAEIDEEKLMRVIRRHSLEAARRGMELAALRNNLREPEDISSNLEEAIAVAAAGVAAGIRGSIEDTLRRTVIEGVRVGGTTQEIVAALETRLDEFIEVPVKASVDEVGGVKRVAHMRVVKRRTVAEAIARTESSRFFNEGTLDTYEQNDVRKVQWILASDACPICIGISGATPGSKIGNIFTLSESRGLIPAHISCRCSWVVPG